ncbi:WhiB family transcriptional regulator [Nocardia sp. NPDC003482]|uniref:WhiB family transcriptional regulator n=1 Tax=Nocardia sp. NPDC004068 TaxID=3364303 RepID=UPI0036C0F8B8
MNWRSSAACRYAAPGIFHPPPPPKGDPRQALALCRDCPVVKECAAHALTVGLTRCVAAGVWLAGDSDAHAALRRIAAGRTRLPRCVRCWRLVNRPSQSGSCAHCGFAEIPA